MQRYWKEGDPEYVDDPWAVYEGVYQTPTKREHDMIAPFLLKFAFEDDGFVEEDDEHWVELKKFLEIPNLRGELMDFLHQVRESKGYDVDRALGFFWSPFLPLRLDLKRVYDEAKAATDTAIKEINCLKSGKGKRYEFVSLEKYVRVDLKLLLTFTVIETNSDTMEIETDSAAMEIDDPNADATPSCLKTIQAMVHQSKVMVFHLVEWKFKPPPVTPFRVPYCVRF